LGQALAVLRRLVDPRPRAFRRHVRVGIVTSPLLDVRSRPADRSGRTAHV